MSHNFWLKSRSLKLYNVTNLEIRLASIPQGFAVVADAIRFLVSLLNWFCKVCILFHVWTLKFPFGFLSGQWKIVHIFPPVLGINKSACLCMMLGHAFKCSSRKFALLPSLHFLLAQSLEVRVQGLLRSFLGMCIALRIPRNSQERVSFSRPAIDISFLWFAF